MPSMQFVLAQTQQVNINFGYLHFGGRQALSVLCHLCFPYCFCATFLFFKPQAKTDGNPWVIDPSNAYYVLNPEDNLPSTQKIFQNWFERYSTNIKYTNVSGSILDEIRYLY